MNYRSPNEILNAHILLFPGIREEWNDENPYFEDDGSFNAVTNTAFREKRPLLRRKAAFLIIGVPYRI